MKETLEIVTRTAVIHNQLMPSKPFFSFWFERIEREREKRDRADNLRITPRHLIQ